MKKIKTKIFKSFLLKHFFSDYLFLVCINLLLINTICSIGSILPRDDTSREVVAPKMLELINEKFKENEYIYKINLGDYLIEMKFEHLYFLPEDTEIEKHIPYRVIFSYININIDLIFSLKLTKNKNDFDNNGVYIRYNSKTNSSNLSFYLKNIYSLLYFENIDFEKQQSNNTYSYQTSDKFDIFIDRNTFRYPEKINKFLLDNENELKLFLYESFKKYLTSIIKQYPKADGILLYETILEYIKIYKTFDVISIGNEHKKIVFNEFKEKEIYVEKGNIIFSNIKIKLEIVEEAGYSNNYEVIFPNITYETFKSIFLFQSNIIIEDLVLSTILNNIFSLVIKYYTEEYY